MRPARTRTPARRRLPRGRSSPCLRNPNLRRLQLAFAGSAIGDWAYATAVAVWAYGEGGARSVGIWMAIRFTLVAITRRSLAAFADRFPQKRVMILTDLVRAVAGRRSPRSCLSAGHPRLARLRPGDARLPPGNAVPGGPARHHAEPGRPTRGAHRRQRHVQHHRVPRVLRRPGPRAPSCSASPSRSRSVFMVNVASFVWSMLLVAGLTPRADPGAEDAPTTTSERRELLARDRRGVPRDRRTTGGCA